MRTIYGDHARFEQTYYSSFDGYYFTGDGTDLVFVFYPKRRTFNLQVAVETPMATIGSRAEPMTC